MLRYAMADGGVYGSAQISVTKVNAPKLLALRVGGVTKCQNKKRHVTLEWPLALKSLTSVST